MIDDWLTDWLIDDYIMITRSVIIPTVSGLDRPTGLLFVSFSMTKWDMNIYIIYIHIFIYIYIYKSMVIGQQIKICPFWHRNIKVKSWWPVGMETRFALFAHYERNLPITNGFRSDRASKTELWNFRCWSNEQTVEKNVEMPVIWDATTPSRYRNETICESRLATK